ncbi:TOBE domain-containing protein [Halomarina rubra]|uniref:Molybdopterin-binding protein n=1 Tax=Halomarina rubra TaxID=2071873 RepID=A0ABD6B155_9EURY|nr:TOBE domain-containing protein [Halomarina rubra]
MALSARNRIEGTVTNITVEGPVAEVVLDVGGGNEIAATITSGSVERLGLAEGDEATAVVKASDVMLSN